MKMTFEMQRTHIMNTMDWNRVHKMMTALNWTWCGYIPTTDEMKSTVEGLLMHAHRVIEESTAAFWAVSTGGFEVTVHRDDHGDVRYTVAFQPIKQAAPIWEVD